MTTLCAVLTLWCVLLVGSNAMAGRGKDLQTGGEKGESAAYSVKQKM